MKNQKKYQKGITLIALVITIIVLLILAGVTLSIVFNGGIINKSQTAVDKYTEEQAKEKLSLALFEYKMDKVTKKEGTDLQTTLSKLGPVIEAKDTNYYEVEIDGYLFWVHKEKLEIISQGPSNPVPPTKIEFSSATAEAYIGEGKTFSLKLEPQNANPKFLKWSVNDESVAKIQNGVLTGLKEGTVIVTVTSTEDASIIGTCTVIVKPIELTGITLNKKSTTIGMGKTEKLEVTYTPANATYKDIIWSTSDDTIATVENGTLRGIKAGTATITATSVKNSSINAECNVTVEEIIEISTVEELKAFRDNVNNGNTYAGKKVVLTNDLDLNPGKYTVASDGTVTFNSDAEQWEAIGTGTNNFKGSFDGHGHTISGLYINKPTENYQGLFGYIEGTSTKNRNKIENLKINNVNIKCGEMTAGIVGVARNVIINKCAVTSGNITGVSNRNGGLLNESYTGGIIGSAMDSIVKNCYNGANISGIEGSLDEQNYVGGICGSALITSSNLSSYIFNCYNTGNISGKSHIGGIVGREVGITVNNCFNYGQVTGDGENVGGIAGKVETSYECRINNCYNNGNVSGNKNIGGIIGYVNAADKLSIDSCSYLTGTASTGIGAINSGTATIEPSNTLPSVLSVINGDNAFVEGENGYPILSWQDK